MRTARQQRTCRHKARREKKKQERLKQRILRQVDDGSLLMLFYDPELGLVRDSDGFFIGDPNGEIEAVVVDVGDRRPHRYRRLNDEEAVEMIVRAVSNRHKDIDSDIPF